MNKVFLFVMVLCSGLMVIPSQAAVYYELWGDVIAPIGEGPTYVDANGDGIADPALLAIDWRTVPAPGGEGTVPPFGQLNNFKVGPSNDWAETYTYRQIAIAMIPAEGDYSIWCNSDDGSVVFVDGILVANFDGLHGGEDAAAFPPGYGKTLAPIHLTPGPHLVEVLMYEQGSGDFLDIRFATTTNEADAVFIPDEVLSVPVLPVSPASWATDVPLTDQILEWTNPRAQASLRSISELRRQSAIPTTRTHILQPQSREPPFLLNRLQAVLCRTIQDISSASTRLPNPTMFSAPCLCSTP